MSLLCRAYGNISVFVFSYRICSKKISSTLYIAERNSNKNLFFSHDKNGIYFYGNANVYELLHENNGTMPRKLIKNIITVLK